MSYLSRLLTQRFQDLLTGRSKLTDFPEYMSAEKRLRRTGAMSRMGTTRQAARMGIRGPAAAMLGQRAEERAMAPMGSLLASIPQQAMNWAQSQDQLALQNLLGIGALSEQAKARKAQSAGINLGILGRWGA